MNKKKILILLLSTILTITSIFQSSMFKVSADAVTTTISSTSTISSNETYDNLEITGENVVFTITGSTGNAEPVCVHINNSLVIKSGASIVATGNVVLEFDVGAKSTGLKLYDGSQLLTGNNDYAENDSNGILAFDWDGTNWILHEESATQSTYQVNYDEFSDDNGPRAFVKVGDTVIAKNTDIQFTCGDSIAFTLCPPSERNGATPIVEIEVFDDDDNNGNTVLRSDSNNDNKINLTKNGDNYNFTYSGNCGFFVNVWWSNYDAFGYDDNAQFQISVEPNDHCDISVSSGYVDSLTTDYGNKYNYLFNTQTTVTFSPEEDYALDEIWINSTKYCNIAYYPDYDKTFTVGQDGSYTYSFTNNDLYIDSKGNSAFVSVSTRGVEDSGGDDDPGTDDPQVDLTQYIAAKNEIENADIAYYATDANSMKTLIAAHLWDAFFDNGDHKATYNTMFANKDAVASALTIDDSTSNGNTIPNKANDGYLPYYNFSITLYDDPNGSDDVVANGKVYVLENNNDVVAKFTNGNNVTYVNKSYSESNSVFEGSYSMKDGQAQVKIFGNALDPVGTWDSGNPEYLFAGHLTKEHFSSVVNDATGGYFTVVNTNCNAIKVTGNGEYGTAAAWGWSNLSWYATNGTTASNPKEFDVYIGDTIISISKADTVASKEITSIVCSLENASKAVEITETNDVYNIKPLSNFYNSLPLTITYEDGTKAYIKINRVALSLDASLKADGNAKVSIMHGTDNCKQYDADGSYAIYGSFYYPYNKTAESNGRVNLEVTYTWADGSTTRETISPINGSVITDASQGTTHVDDFIIWSGEKANRPIKVEATAIVSGSSETSFKGALIGSGAGVTWKAQ